MNNKSVIPLHDNLPSTKYRGYTMFWDINGDGTVSGLFYTMRDDNIVKWDVGPKYSVNELVLEFYSTIDRIHYENILRTYFIKHVPIRHMFSRSIFKNQQ